MPNLKSSKNLSGYPKNKTQNKLPQDWYQAIIASTNDGFFIVNLKGEFLDVNDTFCHMLGYSRYELLAMKLQDIEALETPEEIRQHGFKIKSSGSDLFNTCLRSKDGRIIEARISAKYLGDDKDLFFVFARDITEQKKLCKQLKESEERYRALIELGGQVNEAVVMLQDTNKGEGVQTFVNNEWCHITGYSEEELLGMSFFDLLHPRYRKASLKRHQRKLNGESIPRHFEMSIIRKDGREVPVEVTSGYTVHQGKRANVAYIRDITERKQAEESLRRSEEKLRLIFEALPEGITVLDTDGKIVQSNKTTARIYGYDNDEEIIGLNIFEFIAKKDLTRVTEIMKKTLKDGYLGAIEFTQLRGNQGEFSAEVSGAVIKDTSDNPIGFVTITKDITERKQMENQLKKATSEYLATINMTGDIILRLDRDGNRILVNDGACKFFGLPREEMLNAKFGSHLHPDDKAKTLQAIDEMMKTGEPILGLINRQIMPLGTRTVEWNTHPFFDKNGQFDGWQATGRDITERKKMEEELKQYSEHLEELVAKRTNELEEQLGQRVKFTRSLVHDLKTPLTPLIAASDFLVSRLNEEPLLSFAKNINKGALDLSSKIDKLLDLAKSEVGILQLRYGQVELLPLLEDTVGYMEAEASRNKQSLILDVPSCLPIVWADGERLRQVLLNLLDNALKFTPKGGEITLKVREKNAGIMVEVKDNGCGIDEEGMKHLFEPYSRHEGSKASLSGLGLGLALSKMFIELHGGKIWAESQEGKGSTFSFWLPLNHTGQEVERTEKI